MKQTVPARTRVICDVCGSDISNDYITITVHREEVAGWIDMVVDVCQCNENRARSAIANLFVKDMKCKS